VASGAIGAGSNPAGGTPSVRLIPLLIPAWYSQHIALSLRLSEADADALARQAAHEGRSQHDIVAQAIREYVERTSRRDLLDSVLDRELPRYAEALERLGP
jgi:hypothetical protein